MTVSNTPSRNQYIATGGQTVFPYTFEIIRKEDIAVIQNNTTLSEGTHYTVSGVGVDSGSNVTLVTGATAGDTITIYRNMDLSRVTNYQAAGDFLADTVDNDIDRTVLMSQQIKEIADRSIKPAINDSALNSTNVELASPVTRANKLLGFSSTGTLDYISGSAAANTGTFREYSTMSAAVLDIANISIGDTIFLQERSSGNGGASFWNCVDESTVVEDGYRIVTGDSSKSLEMIGDNVSVRAYGATSGESSGAIQAALDYGYLDLEDISTQINTTLTLSSNVIIRADKATITRQTGATAFDMLYGTGLTNLDIEGLLILDGNKDADSLVQANADDRFCGLRLINCTGRVSKIKAINTVNGEIQAEGNRGGIMFENCDDNLVAEWLYTDNTDGSGVFAHTSSMAINHVRAYNSTGGSGFTTYSCDDLRVHDIYGKTSAYSAVSLNGERVHASKIRGEGAPSGYANVTIGHDAAGNRADNSIIQGVISKDSGGWGMVIVGSTGVQISDYYSDNSTSQDIRVFSNSDRIRITGALLENGGANGLSVESGAKNFVSGMEIREFDGSGVSVSNGAHVELDANCHIHDNAVGLAANTGNILINNSTAKISGKVLDSYVDNVICSGASGKVLLDHCRVGGAAGSNFSTLSSGSIEHNKTRLSDADNLTGQFTASAGTSTVVNNANSVNINGITLQPRNSAARAFRWDINSISEGVSFTINFNGTLAGSEVFSYQLN